MSVDAYSLNCLICSNKLLASSAQLTGREIRSLWRELVLEFPPEALAGIGVNSNIVLWRCAGCGFEFFDPALAGKQPVFINVWNPGNITLPPGRRFTAPSGLPPASD